MEDIMPADTPGSPDLPGSPGSPPLLVDDPHPWTRRLGVWLVVVTFLLIGTGGLVTSYNAGLAVPDWPGSFGNWIFLPARIWSDLAVMLEHNHRLTGQVAGLICIATVVASMRAFGWRSRVAVLAWVVLAAYIYQGVMGGLRVTEKSVPLAVIHGVQGQLLFMLVVVLANCLGRWPGRVKAAMAVRRGEAITLDGKGESASSLRSERGVGGVISGDDSGGKSGGGGVISGAVYGLCIAFVVCMVLQLTLGAVIRHTNSASAIPDAPAVYGGFFPPTDEAVIAEKFYELGGGEWQIYTREPALAMEAVDGDETPDVLDHTPRVAATPPSVGLVHNQYMHRVMGMVVLPVLGFGLIHMLMKVYKDVPGKSGEPGTPGVPGLRVPVGVGSILFVLQVLLGMSVIWSKESPYVASSHQAVGAALLGVATLVLIRVHWVRKLTVSSR